MLLWKILPIKKEVNMQNLVSSQKYLLNEHEKHFFLHKTAKSTHTINTRLR